jgi:hypothetical protein
METEMVVIQMDVTMETAMALLNLVLSRLMGTETVKTQMDVTHIVHALSRLTDIEAVTVAIQMVVTMETAESLLNHVLSRLMEMETEMVATQTDVTMDAVLPNHGLFA